LSNTWVKSEYDVYFQRVWILVKSSFAICMHQHVSTSSQRKLLKRIQGTYLSNLINHKCFTFTQGQANDAITASNCQSIEVNSSKQFQSSHSSNQIGRIGFSSSAGTSIFHRPFIICAYFLH
jgi:hypothetical protein